MKSPINLVLVASLIALSTAGCSLLRPVHSPQLEPVLKAVGLPEKGWWYVRFIMNWPQGAEPSWHMDLFLAHEVLSSVLARYRSEIVLWRFHRRAARDQTGHQFSFIFYSSSETARSIYGDIKCNRHLRAMTMAGVISREVYDDTNKIARPHIEDTSDRNWSSAIQKSWPHYIMGVSQMWLGLIEDFAGRISKGRDLDSPEAVQAFYRKVNESINESWREEGNHALLHHLNAIFGYEPIVIREKRPVTF